MLSFALAIARCEKFTFAQNDMPFVRRGLMAAIARCDANQASSAAETSP